VENKIQIIKYRSLKILLTVFFLIPAMRAAAPEAKVAFVFVSEPVNSFDRLVKAIVKVESEGDNNAFNLTEQAVGAFQIRPIRILDYNQRTGKDYKIENCFDFEVSKEIFIYYANSIGYPDYEKIARKWNGSGKTTLDYWEKVKKHI
jgi:hypothetical protein